MSESKFMELGLTAAGYKFPNRCLEKTNIKRFKKHFGVHPSTCAKLWHDLLSTDNAEARMAPNTKPIVLLIGLRFLWRYETEEILATFFGMSDNTIRPLYQGSVEKFIFFSRK